MAQVEWIKILTFIFEDDKIKLIRDMPEGDTLLVLWFQLLTLAGKKNDYGKIYLTEGVPYTDEMFGKILDRPVEMVRLALKIFKDFKMTGVDNLGITYIINWEKHQNIEGMERIREQNKKRAGKYRKRLTAVGGYNYLEYYQEIFKRDGGKCVYCKSNKNLCLDHLVALIKGGDNEIDNLVLSCKPCNSGKSGKYLEEANYSFVNQRTADQYEKVKKRLGITHTITHNHAIDKIRIDKIRREEKEKKDKKESVDPSIKKTKKEGKEPLEFSFEDKQWWGLYDWRIKMYQGTFPMLKVNYLFHDLWKTKFLSDPEKYKRMIKEQYEGKIDKLVWAWLNQEKKFYLKDHPIY